MGSDEIVKPVRPGGGWGCCCRASWSKSVKQKFLTDGQKIRRRKITEETWAAKWRGRLNDPLALLDLWRNLHRRGCVSLEAFRTFKREHGFYDKSSDDCELG
jgi:hypothetical protein